VTATRQLLATGQVFIMRHESEGKALKWTWHGFIMRDTRWRKSLEMNLTWFWQTMLVLTIKGEKNQKQCLQRLTATIQHMQHHNMYKPDGLPQQTTDCYYAFILKVHFW